MAKEVKRMKIIFSPLLPIKKKNKVGIGGKNQKENVFPLGESQEQAQRRYSLEMKVPRGTSQGM